jgi:hypothetical protein
MALPNVLAARIKSIPMDPVAIANDLELAYLLSFTSFRNLFFILSHYS